MKTATRVTISILLIWALALSMVSCSEMWQEKPAKLVTEDGLQYSELWLPGGTYCVFIQFGSGQDTVSMGSCDWGNDAGHNKVKGKE